MGDTPVARPSPISRWTFPKRGLMIALVLLSMFAVGGVALATLWPSASAIVLAARLDELRSNAPVHNSNGFYVVLLPSGEVLALLERDPHGYSASNACQIEWRPDFVFEYKTGWFRGKCSGSTFDVNGTKAYGPSPRSMDRSAVEVKNGDVLVDTSRVICPPSSGGQKYCD